MAELCASHVPRGVAHCPVLQNKMKNLGRTGQIVEANGGKVGCRGSDGLNGIAGGGDSQAGSDNDGI
jgi:hypothetical protein